MGVAGEWVILGEMKRMGETPGAKAMGRLLGVTGTFIT